MKSSISKSLKLRVLLGFLFLFVCPSLKAQTYELLCPAGTRAVDLLTTTNQSTGKLRQNYCVDVNGNVSESLGAAIIATTTIQAAINAAPSGATVIIPAGCSNTVATPSSTIAITQSIHLIIQCDVISSQSPNISILSSGVIIEGNGDNSRPANGTNAPTWTNSGTGNTIIYGNGTLAYRGLIIDKLNFLKSTPATSANILFRANAADITVRDVVTDGLGFDATEGNQQLNRFERVRVNRAVNVGFNYNCTVVCNSIVFDSTYANATSGTGIGYDTGNINATFKGSDADGGAIGYRFVGVGQVVAIGSDDESNTTAGWQITGATGQVTLVSAKTGAEVLPISITGAASVTIINPFTLSTSGANSLVVGVGATGQNLLIADSGFDKLISISAPGSIQRLGSLAALQGPLTMQNLGTAPGITIPIDTLSIGAGLRISDTHAGGCNWDFGELFAVTVLDLRAVNCGGGGVAFNSGGGLGRAIFTFNDSTDRIINTPNAASITPSFLNCGTTSACAQTNQTRLIIVNGGPIALVAGTLTITSLPFTSSTSYTCSPDDSTGINGIDVVYVSGSSVTFNGTGTDSIRYSCQGN